MPEATILVVDDEKNTREALSKILREDGYDVIATADGYQALDVVTDEPADTAVFLERNGALGVLT